MENTIPENVTTAFEWLGGEDKVRALSLGPVEVWDAEGHRLR